MELSLGLPRGFQPDANAGRRAGLRPGPGPDNTSRAVDGNLQGFGCPDVRLSECHDVRWPGVRLGPQHPSGRNAAAGRGPLPSMQNSSAQITNGSSLVCIQFASDGVQRRLRWSLNGLEARGSSSRARASSVCDGLLCGHRGTSHTTSRLS